MKSDEVDRALDAAGVRGMIWYERQAAIWIYMFRGADRLKHSAMGVYNLRRPDRRPSENIGPSLRNE